MSHAVGLFQSEDVRVGFQNIAGGNLEENRFCIHVGKEATRRRYAFLGWREH